MSTWGPPPGAVFNGSGAGEKWVTLGDPYSMGILGRSEGEFREQRRDWESDEAGYRICSVLNIYVALSKSLYLFSLPFPSFILMESCSQDVGPWASSRVTS